MDEVVFVRLPQSRGHLQNQVAGLLRAEWAALLDVNATLDEAVRLRLRADVPGCLPGARAGALGADAPADNDAA